MPNPATTAAQAAPTPLRHPEKPRTKKPPTPAQPASNVVPLTPWSVPLPALTEGDVLACACDVVAIDGNIANAVISAEYDYQKEMLDLGTEMMAAMQDFLQATTAGTPAIPSDDEAMRCDCARAVSRMERYAAANLRLARRLCDAQWAAMEGLLALPRHFLRLN